MTVLQRHLVELVYSRTTLFGMFWYSPDKAWASSWVNLAAVGHAHAPKEDGFVRWRIFRSDPVYGRLPILFYDWFSTQYAFFILWGYTGQIPCAFGSLSRNIHMLYWQNLLNVNYLSRVIGFTVFNAKWRVKRGPPRHSETSLCNILEEQE